MRCQICKRPLDVTSVPGLHIGPKCAKDRGLMPQPVRRVRIDRATKPDPAQADWVDQTTDDKPGATK